MVHPYDHTAPAKIANLCGSNQYIMQNVSEWKNQVSSSNEITACDARDGKTYTIAKLADNNLWMTQNLDHDIVTDGSVVYDSTTTDLPANTTWEPIATARTYNSADVEAAEQAGTDDYAWYHLGDDTIQNYTPLSYPESYDPGDLYVVYGQYMFEKYRDYCQYESCNQGLYNRLSDNWKAYADSCDEYFQNCDDELLPDEETIASTGNPHDHLGNYYNWTAAIAMNDSFVYDYDEDIEVNQSICPAGWTLP